MFLSFDQDAAFGVEPWNAAVRRRPTPAWTVLIPFFNERAFLADTIASIAAQTVPLKLIPVDNGSTDGSADVARAAIQAPASCRCRSAPTRPARAACPRCSTTSSG